MPRNHRLPTQGSICSLNKYLRKYPMNDHHNTHMKTGSNQ